MRSMHVFLATLSGLALVACGGSSEDTDPLTAKPVLGGLAESVRKPLDASNAAIERAKTALAAAPRKGDPELLRRLEDAQDAVKEVIRQQESVEFQLNALVTAAFDMQKRKAAIERDKADLEKRERLFSTGFYAALITALVALAGVMGKYPMMRLDMQIKRLEIREREQKLEQSSRER